MKYRRTPAAYPALFLMCAAILAWAPGEVQAEESGEISTYRITGFSFDVDDVFESSSGLRIETSRFKPLMITDTAADILGGNPFPAPVLQPGKPQGFAVSAEYLATPSLAFHGAIGVTRGTFDVNVDLESDSSWEANIGVVYNLFNSLAYEVHFGYMDTGDVFRETRAYSDVDSIIMISNQLTMSF